MKIHPFKELSSCDLIIDAIYEGGKKGNAGDDPINKLIQVGNQGGSINSRPRREHHRVHHGSDEVQGC